MAKKSSKKHQEPRAYGQPDTAAPMADEPEMPQANINVDDTVPEQNPQHAEMPVTLSFGEKIASIFAPVKAMKEAVAEAEVRDAEAKLQIAELENKLAESETRFIGLQENLAEARASLEQTLTAQEKLKKDLDRALADVEAMSVEVDNAKADSFAEVSKAFPAELQGRFKSYHDMAMALAACESERKTAPMQVAQRGIEDILRDPSPSEKAAITGYCIQLLVDEKLIMNNVTNWRAAINSLQSKNEKIADLNARLAAADARLKEAEAVDPEAGVLNGFAQDTVSERMCAAITPWLQRRINALIENEDRRLARVADLDEQLRAIAEAVSRPTGHDEAVADGVRSVLKPLSQHLGRDVSEVDRLADALAEYFDERLRHDVMARFTEAAEEERRSLESLVKAANAAMADRAKIDRLLKKLATDDIESIYEKAISSHFADIVEKNRPQEAPEAVVEAFARCSSFDGLVRQLVKASQNIERSRAKAAEDLQMANELVEAADAKLRESEEARAAMAIANKEAMAKLRKDTDEELLAQDQRRIDELAKQKNELDAAHAEQTAMLEAGIESRDADIRGLFDAYLGTIRQALKSLKDDVDAAYTGPRDENRVADVIDNNIIENDIYGLDEFSDNLLAKLDGVSNLTADAIRKAVRDAFTEILKIESATWIDNLARLSLYSQVPFISAAFMQAGVRVDRFAAAYAALESILAQGGITLQVPRLFVDRFSESSHNAEAIKNITSVVDDVASHVPDESTVIDLFTVGYSFDGAEVRKPTVSRLNS